MAPDQQHKRFKVSDVIHSASNTQKAKKKKFSLDGLNTRSNISLEWDRKKERVVSKKDQISIAHRELTTFLPSALNYRNALGDVFTAPLELFELENLTGLLSYEVWETCLSFQEREFLTQFLPDGSDPHKVVYELLSGMNLCFGNSFLKWGASVCSGECHPDVILLEEQRNKANKMSYYSELHDYHTKMIGTLQLWREKWASCVDPENDCMQKLLSSRDGFTKTDENGAQYDLEEVDATSGSCSWDADNKLYCNDSQNLAITNGETLTRPIKGDKSRRINAEYGHGAKYMSYIKVSKEQHERVKSSMQHSKMSIQPRSLNHILGDLGGFCVQPYQVFEEEEKQKLHDHWLHLAKEDLHTGFENWKSLRSAKCQITKSLFKELEDKWKLSNQPDSNSNNQYDNNSGFICLELNDDSVFESVENHNAENQEISMQIETIQESSPDTAHNQHLIHNVYYNQPTFVSREYPSISSFSNTQAQSSFMIERSDGGDSFYNPYANQDRNELLPNPFLKDPVSGPAFYPTGSDALLGPGRFSREVCSSLPLVTSNHSIEENIFSFPRQEHMLPTTNHVLDWSVNGLGVNLPMPASSHHQLSQNWVFNDEVADESIFGVLSQCNGLRSGVNFSSTGAMEQFVQPAKGLGLNYMSGNEGQFGWMNMPRTMQETGLKSLSRLWNDKDLGQ